LAIFELECCRIEGVWGDEGARGSDVVGECAVALAEARLVASFEVLVFDRDYRVESALELRCLPYLESMQGSRSSQTSAYIPAGKNKLHSAVHSRKTAVHRGADRCCNVIISSIPAISKYCFDWAKCQLLPQMSDET
jgi:hypothetical protein